MTRTLVFSICGALTAAVTLPTLAQTASTGSGQAYPEPMRVIVPFPAGGGADIFARLMGRKLQDALGQPFIADNRAGASGIIGCEFVARAAPTRAAVHTASPRSL